MSGRRHLNDFTLPNVTPAEERFKQCEAAISAIIRRSSIHSSDIQVLEDLRSEMRDLFFECSKLADAYLAQSKPQQRHVAQRRPLFELRVNRS